MLAVFSVTECLPLTLRLSVPLAVWSHPSHWNSPSHWRVTTSAVLCNREGSWVAGLPLLMPDWQLAAVQPIAMGNGGLHWRVWNLDGEREKVSPGELYLPQPVSAILRMKETLPPRTSWPCTAPPLSRSWGVWCHTAPCPGTNQRQQRKHDIYGRVKMRKGTEDKGWDKREEERGRERDWNEGEISPLLQRWMLQPC